MTDLSIPQDETEGTRIRAARTAQRMVGCIGECVDPSSCTREVCLHPPAPSSPPSGETSDYTRFSHWSTDLLSKQLRDLMANDDVPNDDLLNAVADRLDALYFGEVPTPSSAPVAPPRELSIDEKLDRRVFGESEEPRSAVPETPTLDVDWLEKWLDEEATGSQNYADNKRYSDESRATSAEQAAQIRALAAALPSLLAAERRIADLQAQLADDGPAWDSRHRLAAKDQRIAQLEASLLESERRAEALETEWHEKQAEIDDLYSEISAKVSARDFRIQALEKELAAARSRLSSLAEQIERLERFEPDSADRMRSQGNGEWLYRPSVLKKLSLDPSPE